MSKELMEKAVELLLNGATLVREPCPYCSGVRIMKDGNALCVSCGKEPKNTTEKHEPKHSESDSRLDILEKKLNSLSNELEKEQDHEKQKNILSTINSLIETMQKIKKMG